MEKKFNMKTMVKSVSSAKVDGVEQSKTVTKMKEAFEAFEEEFKDFEQMNTIEQDGLKATIRERNVELEGRFDHVYLNGNKIWSRS